MKLHELKLLELDIYDNDKLIFSGMSEDVPSEFSNLNISIRNIERKKLILDIIHN